MAEVSDIKTPYEILIRFGADGLPRGAHCQYLRRVVLDGEVLKEEIGAAQPIDLKGFPTSDIMTTATKSALAQVTSLNATIEDLGKKHEEALADAEAAGRGRDAASENLAAAQREARLLRVELEQKTLLLAKAEGVIEILNSKSQLPETA